MEKECIQTWYVLGTFADEVDIVNQNCTVKKNTVTISFFACLMETKCSLMVEWLPEICLTGTYYEARNVS